MQTVRVQTLHFFSDFSKSRKNSVPNLNMRMRNLKVIEWLNFTRRTDISISYYFYDRFIIGSRDDDACRFWYSVMWTDCGNACIFVWRLVSIRELLNLSKRTDTVGDFFLQELTSITRILMHITVDNAWLMGPTKK